MNANAPAAPKQVMARVREQEIVTLALQGLKPAQIARAMEHPVTSQRVGQVLKKFVKESAADRDERVVHYRQLIETDLIEQMDLLREAWRERDWSAMDRMFKAQERLARMNNLDQPDVQVSSGTIVLAGHVTQEQLASIPAGHEVIDARPPWSRGEEAIDASDLVTARPALGAGDGATADGAEENGTMENAAPA